MASCFPPTSISRDQFREIFGNSDEEFDENDSDIDFTGFEARGMKKATVKVRKQAVKQGGIPRKQKLHGRSNFQTLK